MQVRVVNVRDYLGKDGDNTRPFVYVGRANPTYCLTGSPLANPFKVDAKATKKERLACLEKYERWLDAKHNGRALLRLLAGVVETTGLPLGCWCGCWPDDPHLICHAVALAKRVQAILDAEAKPCD